MLARPSVTQHQTTSQTPGLPLPFSHTGGAQAKSIACRDPAVTPYGKGQRSCLLCPSPSSGEEARRKGVNAEEKPKRDGAWPCQRRPEMSADRTLHLSKALCYEAFKLRHNSVQETRIRINKTSNRNERIWAWCILLNDAVNECNCNMRTQNESCFQLLEMILDLTKSS